MKKVVLFFMAVTFVAVSAEAGCLFKPKAKKDSKTVPVKILTNEIDTMSYALGVSVGEGLAKNLKTLPDGKCNMDLFIKAFNTSIKGDSALLKSEFVKEFLNNYFQAAQKREVDQKKDAGEKYLNDNKTKDSVKVTASGLQYKVLVAKDGPKPGATDTVKVHYTGTLIDGTKFDSSVDRGEPISFPLNQVIPGWTEGVQLMSVGSKYKFYIPYALGYGEKGAGNGAIPGYATLIFEVELLDIKPFVEAPKTIEVKTEAPVIKEAPKTKTKKTKK